MDIELSGKREGYVQRLLSQRPAFGGQSNEDAPFVLRVAGSRHKPCTLHTLEERGHRRCTEMQPLAKLAHAGRFMLPQEEHDQILRDGKPQRLADWSGGALQQQGGTVERKGDLTAQDSGAV